MIGQLPYVSYDMFLGNLCVMSFSHLNLLVSLTIHFSNSYSFLFAIYNNIMPSYDRIIVDVY